MKLRNTLFLALALSTGPMMQISGAALNRTVTQAANFSLFKMNQTTQNILTGVGIGAGAIALGYFLYWCFRPLNQKELAAKIDALNRHPLAAALLFQENSGTPIQEILNRQVGALIQNGKAYEHTWFEPTWNTRKERRRAYADSSTKQDAPLLRGTAILQDLIKQINFYIFKFQNRIFDGTLSQHEIGVTYDKIAELRKLQTIVNRIAGDEENNHAADQRYTQAAEKYNKKLNHDETVEAEEAKAQAELVKAAAIIEAARIEAQSRRDAARIAAGNNRTE